MISACYISVCKHVLLSVKPDPMAYEDGFSVSTCAVNFEHLTTDSLVWLRGSNGTEHVPARDLQEPFVRSLVASCQPYFILLLSLHCVWPLKSALPILHCKVCQQIRKRGPGKVDLVAKSSLAHGAPSPHRFRTLYFHVRPDSKTCPRNFERRHVPGILCFRSAGRYPRSTMASGTARWPRLQVKRAHSSWRRHRLKGLVI